MCVLVLCLKIFCVGCCVVCGICVVVMDSATKIFFSDINFVGLIVFGVGCCVKCVVIIDVKIYVLVMYVDVDVVCV